MAEYRVVDCDNVAPTEVEHKREEHFDGDECVQKYNYRIYHFACSGSGAYFWARAYIDEIDTISVYGPFESRHAANRISGPSERGDAFLSQATF